MLLMAYLNFYIKKYIACCFSYLEILFHTMNIVFFSLTPFKEKEFYCKASYFPPKYHKTSFSLINDSIMIFNKFCVVSFMFVFPGVTKPNEDCMTMRKDDVFNMNI